MVASVRFRLPPPLPLLLVVCLAVAPAAEAQRVVISQAGPGLAPGTDLLDLATGRVERLTNDISDRAVFTSDGAVLLRRVSGEQHWRARLMATGVEVPLPDALSPVYFGVSPPAIPHPRSLAVLARHRDASNINRVARIDGAGLRVFEPCGPSEPIGDYDLDADGARLIVSCISGLVTGAPFVVVDADTGTPVQRPASPAGHVSTAPVFLAGANEFLYIDLLTTSAVVRADLRTGAVSGTAVLPPHSGIAPGLLPNPRDRNRPLLVRCGPTCTVDVVDAVAMTIGPRLYTGGSVVPLVSFSADGGSVVLSGETYVARVDMATGTPLTEVPAPANGFIVAAWGAEPLTPSLASPFVAAGTVSLSWTLPAASAAVTGYRLEAGYAPGTTAVSLDLGPAAGTSIPGVPPGRYYARLRAMNANGVSASSNEVVIDVP